MVKTHVEQFEKFHNLLMKNAPDGYIPHYFQLKTNGKDPDVMGSWKSDKFRLTFERAKHLMSYGRNIGIAAMPEDRLQLIDIDNQKYRNELKDSLIIRSRKRLGFHGFYFVDKNETKLPANIPTGFGEMRGVGQYVVTAGSYVPLTDEGIKHMISEGEATEEDGKMVSEDKLRGVYTVEVEKPAQLLTFKEIPEIFKNQIIKAEEEAERIEAFRKSAPKTKVKSSGKHSALFDLNITDVVPAYTYDKRHPHPIHDSDTGTNFIIKGNLAHCWRHLVSLNAIQYLCVQSGYMDCQEAGSAHKNSQAGQSHVIGDNGAIFHAWLEAKRSGFIPQDDPIPVVAMYYITRENELCDEKDIPKRGEKKLLPKEVYNKVLKIVEDNY